MRPPAPVYSNSTLSQSYTSPSTSFSSTTTSSSPASNEGADQLQPVEVILRKNSKLIKISTIGRLACKLAQYSIFGEDILQRSTPMGRKDLPPLACDKLDVLKKVLRDLFPMFHTRAAEFEELWEDCILSIQHLCKRLRSK